MTELGATADRPVPSRSVEIVLLVVALIAAVVLGSLLARERIAARAAKERADTELASARAQLSAVRAEHREAEARGRQLADEVRAATAKRVRAETALDQERQATLERIAQAQRMRKDLERRVAAAEAARNTADAARRAAEAARDEALHRSEEALADRDDACAARDEALATLEQAGAGADERVRRAEQARSRLEEQVSAAESARAEAEASMSRLFTGGSDEAVARALWEAEVGRADRAWRSSIAPMVLADPPDAASVGASLTTSIAHELERLREEVGVSTELRGSLAVEPDPLVALVALRSAQELVAETARHCNSVEVTLGGDDALRISVSGEGYDGAPRSLRGVGTLVALASGEVVLDSGPDGSMSSEVVLPLRATTGS